MKNTKGAAHIASLYAFFAVLTTTFNLGTQMLVVSLYHGLYAIEASVLLGTAVGLPLKYVLEKMYVFSFSTDNISHDGKLFFFYAIMGVFTTGLFWGVEYLFHVLFNTDAMRYLGGALGLTLGCLIKYRLDKRYVFIRPEQCTKVLF